MTTFVIIVLAIALIFDLVNGFHDAANSIATVVSTQVLSPRQAVVWAAFFNFIAIFILAPHVADTIATIVHIKPGQAVYTQLVFAGLAAATIWNLITWWLGLPTSSSHALIGGIAGAGLMHGGWEALQWDKLNLTILFIVLAPTIGFILGYFCKLMISWIFRLSHPADVDRWFRRGQLVSAGLYSIGHGANDAQKTMGIIVALLIAAGNLPPNTSLSLQDASTAWIILSCQLAMALGTLMGGWRIVKTMGMKITKLKPVGGFCAETAGAMTLFFATHFGIPVSTTHTINGAIIGVGTCTTKFSNVRWGIATRIFWSWVFTIPTTGVMAALLFWIVVKS